MGRCVEIGAAHPGAHQIPAPSIATPKSRSYHSTGEATRVANMTPAQKAKIPCMFYAYNSCKAKQCAFLPCYWWKPHQDSQSQLIRQQ